MATVIFDVLAITFHSTLFAPALRLTMARGSTTSIVVASSFVDKANRSHRARTTCALKGDSADLRARHPNLADCQSDGDDDDD